MNEKFNKPDQHWCVTPARPKELRDGYGEAVDYVHEDDNGFLWVGNGEYGSVVNYCPICGFKAKQQVS